MTRRSSPEPSPLDAAPFLPTWAERHDGAWARVKDAFRRNWMHNTVGVAEPSARPPTPRADATFASAEVTASARDHLRSLSPQTVGAVRAAGDTADATTHKLRATLSELLERAAQTRLVTDKAVRDLTLRAADQMRRENDRVATVNAARARAEVTWRQVEREAHFGYVARLQHPSEAWGDALEATLRADWAKLGETRSWVDARDGVRCGWEYARNNP